MPCSTTSWTNPASVTTPESVPERPVQPESSGQPAIQEPLFKPVLITAYCRMLNFLIAGPLLYCHTVTFTLTIITVGLFYIDNVTQRQGCSAAALARRSLTRCSLSRFNTPFITGRADHSDLLRRSAGRPESSRSCLASEIAVIPSLANSY